MMETAQALGELGRPQRELGRPPRELRRPEVSIGVHMLLLWGRCAQMRSGGYSHVLLYDYFRGT